jgi:rubrerythrin
MTTDNQAALTVLHQALELERRGHEFYTQAAERTIDTTGKEMLLSLAGDEVLHQTVIQRQIDSLGEGGSWVLPEDIPEVDADLSSPLFPKGKVELDADTERPSAIRPDASDLEALLFGLKVENDSFALYAEQAKQATDANAKRLYEYLADAERTHFNLLMANYESLNSRAGWVG